MDNPYDRGTTMYHVADEAISLVKMLERKNRQYGDSALSPARVFSQADPVEQIKVRIDDKLSRMASNQMDDNEDTVRDLIGYLLLLLVAQGKSGFDSQPADVNGMPLGVPGNKKTAWAQGNEPPSPALTAVIDAIGHGQRTLTAIENYTRMPRAEVSECMKLLKRKRLIKYKGNKWYMLDDLVVRPAAVGVKHDY